MALVRLVLWCWSTANRCGACLFTHNPAVIGALLYEPRKLCYNLQQSLLKICHCFICSVRLWDSIGSTVLKWKHAPQMLSPVELSLYHAVETRHYLQKGCEHNTHSACCALAQCSATDGLHEMASHFIPVVLFHHRYKQWFPTSNKWDMITIYHQLRWMGLCCWQMWF